jgi:effector-binding domain-containing protein
MKALKWIGIALVLIIAILFVISLFLPKEYDHKASILIETSPCAIFEEVGDYANWPKWDPWNAADTNMINSFEGEMGIGQLRSWKSESQGNGSMKTIEFEENKMIKSELLFEGSDKPAYNLITLAEEEEGVLVEWSMLGNMGFNPIGRYWILLTKGAMEKAFSDGLNNLKALCEAKPEKSKMEITVEEKEFPGVGFIAIKHAITDKNQLGALMGADMGALMNFMKTRELQMFGPPFTRYLVWGDGENDTLVFETAIPVNNEVEGQGDIYYATIEACKVASAIHKGAYDQIGMAYLAIENYLKEHEIAVAGAPWESYLTNPQEEPDTSKWMTEVFYPIQ